MSHIRPRAAVTSALLAASVAAGLTGTTAHAINGPTAADQGLAFTARLDIGDGDRACSGVLVAAQWLLTSATCFADNGKPAAGAPVKTAKATIGRTDLTSSTGQVRKIVQLVPRTDRDVTLARLDKPVTGIAPVTIAAQAPTASTNVTVPGYGRTKTEWSPLKMHVGTFTVGATSTSDLPLASKDGSAICAGDTGAPALAVNGGRNELVGINSRSWQSGCFGTDASETRADALDTRVDDLDAWVEQTVGAVLMSDFNCDGVEDIAIADPKASVGGNAGAGAVRVVYGGGKGATPIDQDLDWVPGGAEAGDWFGQSIDTVDYNQDGCTDLVVGTPSEDLGDVTDAGMVDILYGAPGGIGTGAVKNTHFEQKSGGGAIGGSAPEKGDRFGQALAAGTTARGEPFLVIGAPGESIGSVPKAGIAFYVHGTTSIGITNVGITQDSTGVPGAVEANDGFGASVAADAHHIAISAPNDAIGTDAGAGNVVVFSHQLNSEGRPTPLFGLDQDLDTVSGGAEAGDHFGASLALVPYRPSAAAAATDSILAVGSPGEDLTVDGADKTDAGLVQTFQITASGTYSQLHSYYQGTGDDDVTGTAEAGDQFGAALAAANTAPRAVSTTATVKLAVGVPGEAIGTTADAGAVQTFSLMGTPGANDRWIEPGNNTGLPGSPGANQYVGRSIHFTGTQLYIGMPYGPSPYGALHALPLSNVTADGTSAPITTYQPGQDGLPATGARFGYAAR